MNWIDIGKDLGVGVVGMAMLFYIVRSLLLERKAKDIVRKYSGDEMAKTIVPGPLPASVMCPMDRAGAIAEITSIRKNIDAIKQMNMEECLLLRAISESLKIHNAGLSKSIDALVAVLSTLKTGGKS